METKAITALAFDFGTRRIGLAVGNSITGSSQALAPMTADQDDVRFALIWVGILRVHCQTLGVQCKHTPRKKGVTYD